MFAGAVSTLAACLLGFRNRVAGNRTLPSKAVDQDITLLGEGFLGTELVRIVESHTLCGSFYANTYSGAMPNTKRPVGNPFETTASKIRWTKAHCAHI